MQKYFQKIKWNTVIFVLIISIACFVRIYKIEEIPAGIHVDEAGMAYDAFCISIFGVDRALNHLPVYFINFGGGQSALYTYITSIFIKLLGYSVTTIRLPAFFCNMIAIVIAYDMVRKYIGEKSALTVVTLLSINPWNIMASRWGLDCNLMAPFCIIAIYLLIKANAWYDYLLAGISFGIILYTYALSYIIIPVFLLLTFCYMLYTKNIHVKQIIWLSIPLVIFAMPLILMIVINNNIIPEIKSFITIPQLPNYRGTEISFHYIKENISFFKTIFTHDDFIYNAIPQFGTMYPFAIVLSVIGIIIELVRFIKNIKEKKFEIHGVIFLLFLSVVCCMMIIKGPNINKANAIFFPLIFFTYITIRWIYQKWKIIFILIVMAYSISFVQFETYYLKEYKKMYQPYFEQDLITAIQQVNGRAELKERKVCIWTLSSEPYIYTLYTNPISPYEFNQTRTENNDYDRFVFQKTDIDDTMVYIIKDNADLVWELSQYHNFCVEQIGNYVLLYK